MKKLLLVVSLCTQASLWSSADESLVDGVIRSVGRAQNVSPNFIEAIKKGDLDALQKYNPVELADLKKHYPLTYYAHAACLATDDVYKWLQGKGFQEVPEGATGRANLLTTLVTVSYDFTRLQIGVPWLVSKKGLHINQVVGLSYPALHRAVLENNMHAVAVLLENNADPDLSDQKGYAPLYYAQGLVVVRPEDQAKNNVIIKLLSGAMPKKS